jgi:hypothetical protein
VRGRPCGPSPGTPRAVLRSVLKAPGSPRERSPDPRDRRSAGARSSPLAASRGAVDHQVVDVVVRDARLGKGLRAVDAERALRAGDAERVRGGNDYSVAPQKALGHGQTTPTNPSRAPCPSPPACGGRGRDPARQRREGEVGRAAVPNPWVPPHTPTLSAPKGGEGDIRAVRSVHALAGKRGPRACSWLEQGATAGTLAAPGFLLAQG